MSSLERRGTGDFVIENCYTLEQIEEMNWEKRENALLGIEQLFSDYPKVELPSFFEKLAKSGNQIYQKKIGVCYPVGQSVALYGENGFFAIGEVREYDDGLAIKPVKQMVI